MHNTYFGLAGGASVGGGIDGTKRGVSEGIELTLEKN